MTRRSSTTTFIQTFAGLDWSTATTANEYIVIDWLVVCLFYWTAISQQSAALTNLNLPKATMCLRGGIGFPKAKKAFGQRARYWKRSWAMTKQTVWTAVWWRIQEFEAHVRNRKWRKNNRNFSMKQYSRAEWTAIWHIFRMRRNVNTAIGMPFLPSSPFHFGRGWLFINKKMLNNKNANELFDRHRNCPLAARR